MQKLSYKNHNLKLKVNSKNLKKKPKFLSSFNLNPYVCSKRTLRSKNAGYQQWLFGLTHFCINYSTRSSLFLNSLKTIFRLEKSHTSKMANYSFFRTSCQITGRSKGIFSTFKISRILIRKVINLGRICSFSKRT